MCCFASAAKCPTSAEVQLQQQTLLWDALLKWQINKELCTCR